jgi:hypothetical protein
LAGAAEWRFLDDLRRLGFNNVHVATTSGIKYTQSTVPDASNSSYTNQNEQHEDPVTIVKRRLAKGEISKEEYDELRRAIQSYCRQPVVKRTKYIKKFIFQLPRNKK